MRFYMESGRELLKKLFEKFLAGHLDEYLEELLRKKSSCVTEELLAPLQELFLE